MDAALLAITLAAAVGTGGGTVPSSSAAAAPVSGLRAQFFGNAVLLEPTFKIENDRLEANSFLTDVRKSVLLGVAFT